MATVAARGLGPIGGQKLRRKAEATHAFFDRRGGGGFLTIWFTVLFAVLPVGDRSQHETGDIAAETDPGAPVAPRLVGRAIGTTLISGVLFAALVAFPDYAG
jgi:predicted secreted protein